jgi:hypothetical protein
MKLIKYLKGFSVKDAISNLASAMGLAGSLALVNIEAGNLPIKYEKQAQGLIGMSIVLIGFVTGKSSDLSHGQDDESNQQNDKI